MWLFAWKTYGAGGGEVALIVAAIAIVGWCSFHKGAFDIWIHRRRLTGIFWCSLTLLVLVNAKELIGEGVGPIKLVINCSIVGTLIPVSYKMFQQACVKVPGPCRVALRKLYAVWSPVWKVLNQPVGFRGIGSAEPGTNRTVSSGDSFSGSFRNS